MSFCKFISSPKQRLVVRIFVDFVILIACFASVVIFYLVNVHPFERGYFCDDDSIRYPYEDSTVSDYVLYISCLTIPYVIILISELTQPSIVDQTPTAREVICFKWRIPITLQRILFSKIRFFFGALVTEISTDVMKVIVGRLRPNFLDVCQSNFDCINQSDAHLYVQDYECTNSEADSVEDSRRSFPSGHTSIATYAMLFTSIYLQKRLRVSFSTLLKPVLQVSLFLVGAFISLSRIQDNKHHWSDVFGGLVLGTLICFWLYSQQPSILGNSAPGNTSKKESQNDLYDLNTLESSCN